MEGRHFLTLATGHLHMEIKIVFLKNYWAILTKYSM